MLLNVRFMQFWNVLLYMSHWLVKLIENPTIEIKQRYNSLECSVNGIKTSSFFSWTHYSQNVNHIHCLDRIGSFLNLIEYKPYERVGLYTCTATFHGGTNDMILRTSVNVTDVEGMTLFFHLYIFQHFQRHMIICGISSICQK